ncbi:MAG: hypothetical protein INF93_01530 [Rhodobacter sp.]|nr:hypothetical protein [Rhodobacter sp.]
MRRIVWLLLVLMLGAGAAAAQDSATPRRAVAGEACPVKLPDWASAPERYAWAQICAGNVADMQYSTGVDDEAGCDALKEDQPWPDSRLLSPRFIKLIAAREPFVSAPARPAVRVRCARFDEQVRLDEEVVPQSLWLDDSRLPKGVSLNGSRFGRDLSLDGATLGEAGLDAHTMSVAGDLYLQNGVFGGAQLIGASVGGGLAASGSRFTALFQASGLTVGGGVYLRDEAEFAGVVLRGASVGGNLEAAGSRFTGLFNADRLTVGGSVFLRDQAEFAGVSLLAASVGGDLDASGSRFTGLFNADRLTVGRGVFLRGGAEFTGVSLLGASVGGGLDASGSRFTGPFIADRLKVGGGVFLRDKAEFAEVRLPGASVGGNLEASDSRFTGLFIADGLTVGDSVYLRGGAEFAGVNLPGASVGGVVQMQDSTFAGLVDMTGLTAQELALWRGSGSTVKWGKDAELILRNAQVEALQAQIPESWVRADGTPLPLDLQGFRYDRLGGFGSGAEGDLSRIGDAAPLIAWIEAAGDSGGQDAGHAPQPYFQMESVLRAMGAGPAADEVAYARHLHRMDHYGSSLQDWVAWAGEWVWRLLVGFGVYPFRLLWWFAALVVLGTILGRRTGALCTQGWSGCFWYSLENAFPLMEPGRRNRDLFHDHPAVRSFFHFQKIAGFVLGTILVGTLTLLGN